MLFTLLNTNPLLYFLLQRLRQHLTVVFVFIYNINFKAIYSILYKGYKTPLSIGFYNKHIYNTFYKIDTNVYPLALK